MAGDPDVSLVVCTSGREPSLLRLLASAEQLDMPDDLVWEILIVDNSVSGRVDEQIAPISRRLPMRLVREPRPGLSHARNRGLAEARGGHICWTDDDTTLDRAWLRAWTAAFRRHPETDFFGGTILPQVEPGGPKWFRKCLGDWPLEALSATRRPQRERRIDVADLPWGANFAVRRAATAGLWFDPALGHGSGRLGEESHFLLQMIGRRSRGWWVPDCKVEHHIGPDRQTLTHLRDHFVKAGASMAYLEAQHWTVQPASRWNPVRAPSSLLHALRTACIAGERFIHVPGCERQGVRAAARANLYAGILRDRRNTRKSPPVFEAAGAMR